jgi:hypothetical protein
MRGRLRGLAHVAVTLVAVAGLAGPAAADEGTKERAIELFARADTAYARGEFSAAARDYQASFDLVARAPAIYDAARAWDAAGDFPRAADAYQTTLERTDLSGPPEAAARRRLAELDTGLAILDVRGPAGAHIRVAHVDGARAPVRVHVIPGTYPVQATRDDGAVGTTRVTVGAGASVRVEVPVARATSASSSVLFAPTPPPVVIPTSRVVAWSSLGAAALFSGAAVGLGVVTIHDRNAFDGSGDTDRSAHDAAVTSRTLTNVAWGTAAVAGVLGAVLLLVSSSHSHPSAVGSSAAPAR